MSEYRDVLSKVLYEIGIAIRNPLQDREGKEALANLGKMRQDLSEEEGDTLVFRLGQELAKLHQIDFTSHGLQFPFLHELQKNWAEKVVEDWHSLLDRHSVTEPVFEWAIQFILDHAPKIDRPVLIHGNLGAFNILIDAKGALMFDGLSHAHWSDPMKDLGYFLARFGRGSDPAREAGGVGSRQSFYQGYGSDRVDESRIAYWEIYATLEFGIKAVTGMNNLKNLEGLKAWEPLHAIEAQYDLLIDIPNFIAKEARP